MYSPTLSLTSALDGGAWPTPRPGHFIPGTHCIGGWVGPRTGLDVCGKSRPHRDCPRTIQLVASRYTDYVILAQQHWKYHGKLQHWQHSSIREPDSRIALKTLQQ